MLIFLLNTKMWMYIFSFFWSNHNFYFVRWTTPQSFQVPPLVAAEVNPGLKGITGLKVMKAASCQFILWTSRTNLGGEVKEQCFPCLTTTTGVSINKTLNLQWSGAAQWPIVVLGSFQVWMCVTIKYHICTVYQTQNVAYVLDLIDSKILCSGAAVETESHFLLYWTYDDLRELIFH